MEIPYQGRATIIDDFDGIKMITPAKKDRVTVFLGLWLCCWVFAGFFAISQLINGGISKAPDNFLLIWVCGWSVGVMVALRVFLWMMLGKEVVEAGQGTITIAKRWALFIKPKTYDLREAKNFRIQVIDGGFQNGWGNNNRRNGLSIADAGTIRFDYGMQTIKFAEGVDESEAAYLLQKLKDKKILNDRNFEPAKQTF